MSKRRRKKFIAKVAVSAGLAVVAISQLCPVPIELVSVANLVVGVVWVWKV